MEIIHLILGKANPNRMNGVNKVVFQLATNQHLNGKKVAVWGITANPVHDYGDRVFKTVLFQSFKNPFKIDPKLKKELIKYKNSIVVHLHGGWIPIYASLSMFLKKNNIKYVITPHGAYNLIAMKRSNWRKKIYFAFLEKRVLINASKIHSLGESEIIGLNKIYKNDKSILIPYGFENNFILEDISLPSPEFIIGFVGRIDIYTKGLDLLIESILQLKKNGIFCKVWIIGDGEVSTLNKLIEERGLTDSFVLYGSKFGDDKNELIKKFTIFTHLSRNEGIPTAVLEAASLGKPSVLTYATNMCKYVHEYKSGICVKNENLEEITAAFTTMYLKWKNNELNEYLKPCLSMVNNGFSWNKIINDFDKLYL